MIDLPVTDSLAGRLVKDLTLPDGVLISTQIFQDQSEVVHGDTRLKAGATLYLVVNESNISQVRKLFYNQFKGLRLFCPQVILL